MVDAKPRTASILSLVQGTLELPTIPEVLVKLANVIAAPDASADDVADVITKDPAVAANMLRLANSAYYGLNVRVSSINLAVSVLGFAATKRVALQAAVMSQFARSDAVASRWFDPAAFWRHSIYCGVTARVVASHTPRLAGQNPDDAYICGLLHDIGKIVLAEHLPGPFERVLETAAESGRSECVVEQEQLGFTHADVGSVLAIKWFLPEELTVGIRYHHLPSENPFERRLAALIHLADAVATASGHGAIVADAGKMPRDPAVLDELGLEESDVADLLPVIEADFEATELPF